ncbi:IS110 family transposase [Bosea sp. 2KB_26]|uniref:IS110 family transposase n=1 Tax=Bosea sp. 2KB_26 TaxID=3237475 RepID=UPI003F907596
MSQTFDASRSLTALEQDSTIVAVIEMSQAKWLVAAVVPGLQRQPLKTLDADAEAVLKRLRRWRDEAGQAGRQIKRIALAYEAGRDGFWLARWLRARGIEAYVIHPSSIAVSREHRRAKTDRLDTELLMRVFLGWLRGEKRHCSMAAIPTVEEEDARRPNRERGNLVTEQTRIVNQIKAILARFGIRSFRPTPGKAEERLEGLRTAEGMPLPENTRAELRRHVVRLRVGREQVRAIEEERRNRLAATPAGAQGPHAMIQLIARVLGVGVETADMLVNEILLRHLRDSKAVARYAGLTGSPNESGRRRRERGLARAGNARVRCGMIQLAWRFLRFQKDSVLVRWFQARTADGRGSTRKTMIVALARKLLIALWRLVRTGEVPQGVVLRPAS